MLVIFDERIECMVADAVKTLPAGGYMRFADVRALISRDEELITLYANDLPATYSTHVEGVEIPCVLSVGCASQTLSTLLSHTDVADNEFVLLNVDERRDTPLRALLCEDDLSSPKACNIQIIRPRIELFSRLNGVTDVSTLAAKTVSVFGLGSGGGICAMELAKSGVGKFLLVDYDRLTVPNLSRHVCGIEDVGRFKTRAIRDTILGHNPWAIVECNEFDISEDFDRVFDIVEQSDLVIVATDTQESRGYINEVCLSLGKAAIYGAAYEMAFAGEVIRVLPGETGCYGCVRQGMAETLATMQSSRHSNYGLAESEALPEPGLGIDVAFIAMLQAKVALMTLLRDSDYTLGDIDSEMVIWVNQARPTDRGIYSKSMNYIPVRIPRLEDCPFCGDPSL